MKGKKNGPGRLSRIAAMLAAFLLTAALTATLLGTVAVRMMTSEELHIQAATSEETIEEQIRQITAYIRELAEDYGFSPEEVAAAISHDDLMEFNRETTRWWTRIVNDGVLNQMPEWSYEKVNYAVIRSLDDDRIPEDMTRNDVAAEVARLIQKRISRVTMPVRSVLIQKGFQVLRRRVNPGDAANFLSEATRAAGAASLLLTGLIMFLTAKRVRTCLRYFGAALAGAGISCAFGGMLIRSAGIQSMIREVSASMAVQTGYLLRTVTTEAIIGTAVLFLGGIACLILDIRDSRYSFGEHNEKKTDSSPDPVT